MKTTPTISTKIDEFLEWLDFSPLQDEDSRQDRNRKAIKQLLADFAEHITPGKVSEETKDYSDSHQFAGAIAHNCVVDEITKRTKEYLDV